MRDIIDKQLMDVPKEADFKKIQIGVIGDHDNIHEILREFTRIYNKIGWEEVWLEDFGHGIPLSVLCFRRYRRVVFH